MRKVVLLVVAVTAFSGVVSARAESTHDAPKPPFKISHGFSHAFQKYSGITWLSNAGASFAASTILSAKTRGIVHAQIKSYGFTDLLDGEFKSVKIDAHHGQWNGVPFGDIHLATNQPFKVRYFQRKGHNSGLRTPVLVTMSGTIPQRELSKALQSHKVADGLRFLKFDLPGLGEQHLQILSPHVALQDDKISVDSFLVTAGATKDTGVKLRVTARPLLEKERYIKLQDMQVDSDQVQDAMLFGAFAEELFNPLVDFGRYDRNTHAFRMTELSLAKNKVSYAGRLVLAPRPPAKK